MRRSFRNASRSRRYLTACGGALAAALITSGCGESGSSAQATKTVTQVTVTEVKTAPASGAEPAHKTKSAANDNSESGSKDAGASAGSDSFPMPNEVGKGLQEAQDDVQRVSGDPLFFTDSRDASGQGRMQIIDRNWKVCSQNVAPGTPVDEDADISFSAVKLDEDCP